MPISSLNCRSINLARGSITRRPTTAHHVRETGDFAYCRYFYCRYRRERLPLIQIKDISATSLIRVTWLWSYGGTKEPGGHDRTDLLPAPVLAAPCCADGRISHCLSPATCPYTKRGAGRRGLRSYQLDCTPRSQLAKRRGMVFSSPIAAGDLRRFDDAALARRQTAPIGSLAISTSKFRRPP